MNNRRIKFIIILFLFLFILPIGSHALSPGEKLLQNDDLLRKRIQNMNTCFQPFYNKEVKKRLSFMLKTKAEFTEPMLGRMIQYYPFIDSMLRANDLPIDLKYITVIESSLKPSVHSHAGAGGLWQFMSATGRLFGLKVNWAVDERLDPILSTRAAVKYLKHLYSIYDDWTLVLMAYNSGPGRVNRAIERAGGKSYDEIAPYLPRETREYIPKFTAAAFFMKNYKEFGFKAQWPSLDLQHVERKRVYREMRFHEICDYTGIEREILNKLNPSLRKQYIPQSNSGYYLTYPMRYNERIDSFLANFGDKPLDTERLDVQYLSPDAVDNNAEEDTVELDPYLKYTYTVKTGDSWSELSDIFNVNAFRIMYWNDYHSKYLHPRQKIIVYLPRTNENINIIKLLSNKIFGELSQNNYIVRRVGKSKEDSYFVPTFSALDTDKKINLDQVADQLGEKEGEKELFTRNTF